MLRWSTDLVLNILVDISLNVIPKQIDLTHPEIEEHLQATGPQPQLPGLSPLLAVYSQRIRGESSVQWQV